MSSNFVFVCKQLIVRWKFWAIEIPDESGMEIYVQINFHRSHIVFHSFLFIFYCILCIWLYNPFIPKRGCQPSQFPMTAVFLGSPFTAQLTLIGKE